MFTFKNLVRCLPCMVDHQTTLHLVYPPSLTTNPDIWSKPLELLANSLLKQQLADEYAGRKNGEMLVEIYCRQSGIADFSLMAACEQFCFTRQLNQQFCFDQGQVEKPNWLQVVVGDFELTYYVQDDGVSTIAIGLRQESRRYTNKCLAAYMTLAICDIRRFGHENCTHYIDKQRSVNEQALYEIFVCLGKKPALSLAGRVRQNHFINRS